MLSYSKICLLSLFNMKYLAVRKEVNDKVMVNWANLQLQDCVGCRQPHLVISFKLC